jgi:hypothetical protein
MLAQFCFLNRIGNYLNNLTLGAALFTGGVVCNLVVAVDVGNTIVDVIILNLNLDKKRV